MYSLYFFSSLPACVLQGGVKAVVYADTLQAIVMIVGVLAIVIQGAINIGGLGNVMDIAYHGDRLEFFK